MSIKIKIISVFGSEVSILLYFFFFFAKTQKTWKPWKKFLMDSFLLEE